MGTALAILIFAALLAWAIYKNDRFSRSGSHPTHQHKPPDLANFAPPAKPTSPEPDGPTDTPTDPPAQP